MALLQRGLKLASSSFSFSCLSTSIWTSTPLAVVASSSSPAWLSGNRRLLHSKPSSQHKIRRFYKEVSIKSTEEPDGWFTVLLDNRQLKTPKKLPFMVPNEELAELVALEWDCQEKELFPDTMYITSLCNVALDNKSGLTKDERINNLVPFAETDTLSYRNDGITDLHNMQKDEWNPLVDWFAKRYNTDVMTTTTLFEQQHDQFVEKVVEELANMNDFSLAATELAMDTAKSAIIALAMYEGEIDAEHASRLSRLELEFQVERFGEIEWAHTMEKHDTQARLAAAAVVMKLAK
eukprot:m.126722 g.126722  ORF g.126722 m.126722 type:complete len:293 (+) comp9436_c0_seq1:43-921(+)